MHEKLNATLNRVHAIVTGLQLLIIDLPSSYEDSIVQTEVQVQLKQTKTFEQQAKQIWESINVDISDADKNVTIIMAEA